MGNDTDVEKSYSNKEIVAKLRRLALRPGRGDHF